jgi:ribonuclease J
MKHLPGKKDFWFLPLGGSNEIGMNLNLFGHDKQWLMVDLGVTFYDRLGLEVITPDPSFILPYQEHLVGLVLTHAHEDHVGAVPYVWPYLRCPIYATPFTAEIVRQKIADKPWRHEVQIIEVPLCGSIKVGHFDVEYITLTHSIPEPNALAITTPLGRIVHTGDWKIDPMPLIGKVTNESRLIELGNDGVLAMLCDSTNVFSEGESGSEQEVRDELTQLIGSYKNHRISVACFASNVARLETVALAAHQFGRKVCLLGRSLHRMVAAAQKVGYLKNIPNFISDEEAMDMPHSKVLFITTGSQGEPRAALARIASNQHPVVKFGSRDVVFFSSRVIPGNEKSIGLMQNRLALLGVKLITSHEEEIHVSGHPSRGELRRMYDWVRPQILIPVHGEARHLAEQSRFGLECGIPMAIVPTNGSLIQMAGSTPSVIDHVDVGRWAYEGNRLVSVDSSIVKDRARLSIQGCVFVSLILDSHGELFQEPKITFLGICDTEREAQTLEDEIFRRIEDTLGGAFKNATARLDSLKQVIRQTVNQRLAKKPMVEVHILRG